MEETTYWHCVWLTRNNCYYSMLKELSTGVHALEHKAWKCLLLGSSILSKQSSKEVWLHPIFDICFCFIILVFARSIMWKQEKLLIGNERWISKVMKSITDMYSMRQADFSFVPAVNAGISNGEGRWQVKYLLSVLQYDDQTGTQCSPAMTDWKVMW